MMLGERRVHCAGIAFPRLVGVTNGKAQQWHVFLLRTTLPFAFLFHISTQQKET